MIFHSSNGCCGLVRGYFSHQLILSYLKVKSESSNDVKKLARTRTRTRTTNNTIDCVQISQVSLAYSLQPSASLICFMLRGMLAGGKYSCALVHLHLLLIYNMKNKTGMLHSKKCFKGFGVVASWCEVLGSREGSV